MKTTVYTEKAPAPIGPYSQAIVAGNFVFTSGQIALDAETGALVTADIETETRKVMENMKVVLEAASTSFTNVVKTTIFLTDMGNFAKVNEVYASYFDENQAPARETVEVSGLPKGVNVEISMTAVII